MIFSR